MVYYDKLVQLGHEFILMKFVFLMELLACN